MKSKQQIPIQSPQSRNDKLDIQEQHQRSIWKSAQFSRNLDVSQSKVNIQQLNQLKQKAHKSFLQVMQMQHLHQQQIQLLRQQYQQKQLSAKQRQDQLSRKIINLQSQLKVIHKFNMDISNTSFTLDNIQMINCKDLNQTFKNDESSLSILQIKELIQSKQINQDDKLKTLKNQIFKQIKQFGLNKEIVSKIQSFIDRMYKSMKQIQQGSFFFNDKIQQIQKKCQSLETQYKSLQIQYDSSQKQAKFLSDHIKRLSAQKFLLDRKYVQTLKQKRLLQQNLRKLKQTVGKNGIYVQNFIPNFNINDDNKSCVNLDHSRFSNMNNSQDLMLDQLDSSRESVKTMKGSLIITKTSQTHKIFSKNTQMKPFVNPIKNFRKNKDIPIQNIQKKT